MKHAQILIALTTIIALCLAASPPSSAEVSLNPLTLGPGDEVSLIVCSRPYDVVVIELRALNGTTVAEETIRLNATGCGVVAAKLPTQTGTYLVLIKVDGVIYEFAITATTINTTTPERQANITVVKSITITKTLTVVEPITYSVFEPTSIEVNVKLTVTSYKTLTLTMMSTRVLTKHLTTTITRTTTITEYYTVEKPVPITVTKISKVTITTTKPIIQTIVKPVFRTITANNVLGISGGLLVGLALGALIALILLRHSKP